MRRSLSQLLVLLTCLSLVGCSLAVSKPPPAYRAGIVPDCDSSYVPPALDYVATAGSLSTMALDDAFFCVGCPGPWIMAAAFLAAGIFGTRRVAKCNRLEGEHEHFLSLPAAARQQAVDARRATEAAQ